MTQPNQTVLVIDDDVAISRLVRMHVAGPTVKVVDESSGVDGMQRARQGAVDLILLDVDMPGQSGFEVCRELKADESTALIPVVFLTGSNCEQDRLRAFGAGGVDYVLKPFNTQELKARVGSILRAQRLVAERLHMQVALRESESRYRLLAEHSSDMISKHDETGAFLYASPASRSLLGYEPEELVGCAIMEFVHPEDRDSIAATISHPITNPRASDAGTMQYRMLHSSGKDVWVEVSTSRIPEKSHCTLFVSRDISERRLAEQAARNQRHLEEAISAMEQVLGVIGHELRTPLSGLRVMSEYLLTEYASSDQVGHDFIQSIHDEVIRLSDMVNNLLEAARINSGHARWNWRSFDLRDACEHTARVIRPLAEQNGVELTCDVGEDPIIMQGDVDAILRLILNLLSNAHKFTSHGSISLTLCETNEEDGRWILMEVRDTGCGIRQEIRAGLGVPFALNKGVVGSETVTGSGLGLSICKGVAAAHGGTIAIESDIGVGTAVTVRLRADLETPVTFMKDANDPKRTAA